MGPPATRNSHPEICSFLETGFLLAVITTEWEGLSPPAG